MAQNQFTEIVTRHIVKNYGPVINDGFDTPAVYVIPRAVAILERATDLQESRLLQSLTNAIWDGYSGGDLAKAVATEILNDLAV